MSDLNSPLASWEASASAWNLDHKWSHHKTRKVPLASCSAPQNTRHVHFDGFWHAYHQSKHLDHAYCSPNRFCRGLLSLTDRDTPGVFCTQGEHPSLGTRQIQIARNPIQACPGFNENHHISCCWKKNLSPFFKQDLDLSWSCFFRPIFLKRNRPRGDTPPWLFVSKGIFGFSVSRLTHDNAAPSQTGFWCHAQFQVDGIHQMRHFIIWQKLRTVQDHVIYASLASHVVFCVSPVGVVGNLWKKIQAIRGEII